VFGDREVRKDHILEEISRLISMRLVFRATKLFH
jgi:hypothetical protein